MKYVVGVVRGSSLEKIRRALGQAGIYRLTVGEVEVFNTGEDDPLGAAERRLRLEIAVNDSFLNPALEAFKIASEGDDDTTRVTVLPVEDVVRIRTGETGQSAI